jgi:hypothetical protein
LNNTTAKATALLLGVGLSLTACGGSDEATRADVSLPASPSVTEELTPNACGDETYRDEHAEYCANVDPLAGSDEGAPPDTNDRGNIESAIGQEIPLADGGTFTVDSITPVALPCETDTEYTESVPENGTFIRLEIRAATAPAAEATQYTASVSPSDWSFIQADGVTFNGSLGSFSAFACLEQSSQFPSTLGPGQQYVGSEVLDVPDTAGTLVYRPSSVYQAPGYEIKLAG